VSVNHPPVSEQLPFIPALTAC